MELWKPRVLILRPSWPTTLPSSRKWNIIWRKSRSQMEKSPLWPLKRHRPENSSSQRKLSKDMWHGNLSNYSWPPSEDSILYFSSCRYLFHLSYQSECGPHNRGSWVIGDLSTKRTIQRKSMSPGEFEAQCTVHPWGLTPSRYLSLYSAIVLGTLILDYGSHIFYIYGTMRASRTINAILVDSVLSSTLRSVPISFLSLLIPDMAIQAGWTRHQFLELLRDAQEIFAP